MVSSSEGQMPEKVRLEAADSGTSVSSITRLDRKEPNTELDRFWLLRDAPGLAKDAEGAGATGKWMLVRSAAPSSSTPFWVDDVDVADMVVMREAVRRFRKRLAGSSSSLEAWLRPAKGLRELRPKKLRRLLSLDMPGRQLQQRERGLAARLARTTEYHAAASQRAMQHGQSGLPTGPTRRGTCSDARASVDVGQDQSAPPAHGRIGEAGQRQSLLLAWNLGNVTGNGEGEGRGAI